jgi:hypothetical protein
MVSGAGGLDRACRCFARDDRANRDRAGCIEFGDSPVMRSRTDLWLKSRPFELGQRSHRASAAADTRVAWARRKQRVGSVAMRSAGTSSSRNEDEGCVGAVLKQAADEIGQQVLVRADRA